MEGPLAAVRCEIRAKKFVSRLPVPEHFAAIQGRRSLQWIAVIQLEWHADREADPAIALRFALIECAVDRCAALRARISGQVEQGDVPGLPGRRGAQAERMSDS